MYTQCPECLTVYEIGEDALRASLGMVCCGNCATRFDAMRTLSETLPAAPHAAMPEVDPGERVPTLADPVVHALQDDPLSRPDDPGMPPDAGGASAQDDVEDWFASLESELAAPANVKYADAWLAGTVSEPVDVQPAGENEVPPEPWDLESDALRAMEIEAESAAIAAMVAANDAPDAPAHTAGAVAGEDGASTDSPALSAASGVMSDPTSPDTPTDAYPQQEDPLDERVAAMLTTMPPVEVEPAPSGVVDDPYPPRDGDLEEPASEVQEPPPDMDPDPVPEAAPAHVYVRPRPHRVSRPALAWAAGCVVLALTLAAQLAWAHRAELFRDPATRPWVVQVCQHVPCRIGPVKDVARLELLSRDVRPDPDTSGALVITATLRNNAGFSQPWPVVVVELADLDNHPVAMRRFRPTEYMPDPAKRAAGIAPGATAAVAFRVADPGRSAVSFQFGFE